MWKRWRTPYLPTRCLIDVFFVLRCPALDDRGRGFASHARSASLLLLPCSQGNVSLFGRISMEAECDHGTDHLFRESCSDRKCHRMFDSNRQGEARRQDKARQGNTTQHNTTQLNTTPHHNATQHRTGTRTVIPSWKVRPVRVANTMAALRAWS
jgi:hypothetical protein